MTRRLKFKIGQIWIQVTTGVRYTVEDIDSTGLVIARRGLTKEVRNFIHVDKNHIAEIDISNWNEIIPRECVCGIHRSRCTYHQQESYQILER